MNVLKLSLVLLTLTLSQANAGVSEYVETIKSDPNALYAFLKDMPKGGELHYHFSGSSYAENILELAGSRDNYCLDPTTFTVNTDTDTCHGTNLARLTNDPTLYNQTIRAWSMKNFIPGQESSHDHFFNAFVKFGTTVSDFASQLLADIVLRASSQHVLYMEIMKFYLSNDATYAKLIEPATTWAEKQRILLANPSFQNSINQSVQESDSLLVQTHQALGCNSDPKKDVCSVVVKFQYFVKRNEPLNNVFAQALAGFVAASRSKNIVAINLVEPEDGIYSLRDYHTQMTIFKFLHKAYPDVHISLHAGELEPQTVTPADLRFHVRDAVITGHAQRIGHGASIAYENNSQELLNEMARQHIAIEVNLSSSRAILNLYGKNHPLNYFIKNRIPVVLSTDDEGILRTDLTRQYVEAIQNHQLDYPTIRTINRNALTYSFLPGKSIWMDSALSTIVPECQKLMSVTCKEFIRDSEKAKLQWRLENNLAIFESKL